MTREESVAALAKHLYAGDVVDCELGTFFCVHYPEYPGRNPRTGEVVMMRAKRLPHFVPSDALLTAVGEDAAITRAQIVDDLRREEVGTVSLTSVDPILQDPDDSKESIEVPSATATLSVPELFDHVVSKLATRGPSRTSGLGTFRRLKVRRGALRGGIAVCFEASTVLKAALNDHR